MDPWGRGVVGHRAGKVDPLVEVRVVKLSSCRSSRVRFVAEEFEGREEWVPPARLKAPWAQVETYALREALWDAVTAASPVRGLAEDYAAMQVFDTLIDETLATLGYNQQAGVTSIHDVDGLARFLGLDAAELRAHPLAFADDGALVVPWPITERIVRRAAQRDPEPILRQVAKDEAEQRRRMTHGSWSTTAYGGRRHLGAEFYVEQDEEPYGRPCRELLRQWCGVEAVERHDELAALREEAARLAGLVLDAVAALRRAGAGRDAKPHRA